jgi:hypothetical protein
MTSVFRDLHYWLYSAQLNESLQAYERAAISGKPATEEMLFKVGNTYTSDTSSQIQEYAPIA